MQPWGVCIQAEVLKYVPPTKQENLNWMCPGLDDYAFRVGLIDLPFHQSYKSADRMEEIQQLMELEKRKIEMMENRKMTMEMAKRKMEIEVFPES